MSALGLFGVATAVLGVVVLIFSRSQGFRLLLVAAGLLVLSSFDLPADRALLVAVAVAVVALGMAAVRRLRPAALLALLLAVCVGASWALGVAGPVDHGDAPPSDAVDECRDVAFVGLRGSGEARDAHGGYGEVVGRVRDELAVEVAAAGLTFADMPVDYPALAVESDADWSLLKDLTLGRGAAGSQYLAGADVGAGMLASTLALIRSLCGDRTRAVVVGYSQGAMAAHVGLASADPGALGVVASVDLVADPLRADGTLDDMSGTVPAGQGVGVVATPSVPVPLEGVRSWCLDGDAVCAQHGPLDVGAFVLGRMPVHTEGYLTNDLVERIAASAAQDLAH